MENIPNLRRPLYENELISYIKLLKIPFFKGSFARDAIIPKPWQNETIIFNLDSDLNEGTHWVCALKKQNTVLYYDSFGLQPPLEIIKYFSAPNVEIFYNHTPDQKMTQTNCGYRCLKFLYKNSQIFFKKQLLTHPTYFTFISVSVIAPHDNET